VKKALGEAGAEASVCGTELLRKSPAAAPFVGLAPIAIAELQKRIGPGTALVWYVPTDRSLYQFILTSQRVSVQFAAVERQTLMSLVGSLNAALRRTQARGDSISRIIALPDPAAVETLRRLHEAFVRPGESEYAGVELLLLVMPRELGFVPVHALRKGALPGMRYLGEEKIVCYVPGGAWCTDPSREWTNRSQTIVGMGYAGSSGWDVEYELRDIRAFFKEARLFFGDDAAMERVRSEQGDLFHIAAEFRYAAGAPWSASVILSGGRSAGIPVILPAPAFAAGVRAPAVIISNLAPDQPGIPAIVAPLLLSGSGRAVIANAYTPSRKLKKMFGEAFYTGLQGGATPPQAYRGALRELIRNPEFSSPLVWGTFQLWGK
jgi:CHAT domain-containing protein